MYVLRKHISWLFVECFVCFGDEHQLHWRKLCSRDISRQFSLYWIYFHICFPLAWAGDYMAHFTCDEHRIYFPWVSVDIKPSMSQPKPDIGRDMSLLSLPKTMPMFWSLCAGHMIVNAQKHAFIFLSLSDLPPTGTQTSVFAVFCKWQKWYLCWGWGSNDTCISSAPAQHRAHCLKACWDNPITYSPTHYNIKYFVCPC